MGSKMMSGFVGSVSAVRVSKTASTSMRTLGSSRVVAAPCGRCSSRVVPRMTAAPMTETSVKEIVTAAPPSWKVQLLYDGDCPLCMKEVNFLLRKDGGQGIIDFVDISDLFYEPSEHQGVSYSEAMGRIHAILASGEVVVGVQVFRHVYSALGMGWVYAITKLPLVGSLADSVYNLWADWRLRITGRKDLAELIKEREEQLAELGDCEETCVVEFED